jgi:hypothetical protein
MMMLRMMMIGLVSLVSVVSAGELFRLERLLGLLDQRHSTDFFSILHWKRGPRPLSLLCSGPRRAGAE